ncbi:MAG: ACP S-malonyltransferase [Luteitalea sp.]
MIACLFPGQGSQSVGMGRALVEAFPEAHAIFDEADAALGRSISTLCFDGPESQLTLTEHTQPAILTASVAAWRVLAARGLMPAYAAGHSLGEYSAHVAAGTLAFTDAVRVVAHRGQYMQEAVPVGSGAMAAVLGLEAAEVEAACAAAAQGEVVSPANFNAPGQVVIAGSVAAVARAGVEARARGARRVVPLNVNAPFHCALMAPAQARLEPELRALGVQAPRFPVVANIDALPRTDGASAIDALVAQVSGVVRWEQVIGYLVSAGVRAYVEVGPGTVLAGLVRKIDREAQVVSFGAPEQLAAVEALFAAS